MLAHPDSSAVLGTAMASSLVDRLLLTNIPNSNLFVARGGHEHSTASVPRETLHNVAVLESQRRLASANIPNLDCEVARGGGEDILGSRVEEDLSDFSIKPPSKLAHLSPRVSFSYI